MNMLTFDHRTHLPWIHCPLSLTSKDKSAAALSKIVPTTLGLRSQFVEEDGKLTDVEENVVLARVGYERGEVLSDDTVPVGRVLFVEEGLEIFGDFLLSLFLIDSAVNLLLDVVFHVLVHLADHPCHIALCHFQQ
ncbi:hypothetical protein FGO68_gene4135 [Halteria grandinella]|uniref:Uncharacterized protein n=1 Tax=Halteria grandinella TaxID=5974 RepID=A0A8J8SZI6_HALGN|nr:hypothetical protein FGO68_gene4135 [Halteria grandinella]